MSDDYSIKVSIPIDDDGMLGRECPECEKYFKLKPGTGLDTELCHCPYCQYSGSYRDFWTKEQLEYAKSIALGQVYKELIKPSIDNITKSFKDLERSSRNSFVSFKVRTTSREMDFPVKYFSEKELETTVTCSNCNLEFSIYGVFSFCPDCKEINAFLIYKKSIDTIRKKLNIFSKPEIPDDIVEISLPTIISSCISAFDGLGKELRVQKPSKYPPRPKNLFQNLYQLNQSLNDLIKLNHTNFDELLKYFQVRHLYEHNFGVIDDDFIAKIPGYSQDKGKKFPLEKSELGQFIDWMEELGEIIESHY